jgi:AcrR family transcriptional regulator
MAAPRKENLREEILRSTTALLGTAPFEAITLARIAQAAGISKGTLYYYYSSKEDILFDICDRELAGLARDLTAWAGDLHKDTRAPRLVGYILVRGAGSAMGNLRLYLIGAAISGQEPLRQKYIERYREFEASIEALLARRLPGADCGYLTWLLLTAMDGLLVQRQLHNPDFDEAAFVAKTTALICAQAGLDTAGQAPMAPLHGC